ncbi:MAG: type VI secretion protein IcmF/TssM N-terminal domain-containing protein [Puniceicoccales bacterium]
MINLLAQINPGSAVSSAQSAASSASSQAAQATTMWQDIKGWFAKVPSEVWWIIGYSILGVLFLIFGYWLFLRIRRRRRARRMRAQLGKRLATPSTTKTEARTDLSAIRKRFQDGLTQLSRTGREIYTLPWYLVMGESGAGKTEAIRHSGLDFPEGLHDPRQGVGGTINMDWWFSNHAVLLDTAGRMLMEGIETGRTPEWEEFLRLLRKHRPNSPINGAILAISAESLIMDSDDDLEAKMQAIGEQISVIQQVLDVRFPVYVLITKCDRLTGMEPMMESHKIMERPGQMLGWSNPEPLETAFRTDLLRRGFHELQQRIQQLTFHALRDPGVFGNNLKAAALQQLPDDFERMTRRVEKFIEGLFLPGQWNYKPLFLRGVYFTSAQQSGEPLDASLAKLIAAQADPAAALGGAHGGATESAHGSTGFPRDIVRKLAARYPLLHGSEAVARTSRPFFLHDLFLEKIVREQGLVTRASNAFKRLRQRRLAVFWTGIGLAILFFACSWWIVYSRNQEIHQQRLYWQDAAARFYFRPGTQILEWSPITEPETSTYYGFRTLTIQGVEKPVFVNE